MHVVIRADGGPAIGFGHLVRTNAIASEVVARNHRVTYATTTPESVRQVISDEVEVTTLESRGSPEPFVDWLRSIQPDIVLADAYPVDTEYQRSVRDTTPLAILADDDRHAICADLLLNGNLYATNLDYEFVHPEPRKLLGPDHVLLRRAIREFASKEPPWREQPQRAIVIMGGSDTAGLTPTVVRSFDGFDLRVDAIIGPGVSEDHERAVSEAANDVTADIRIAHNPDDLAERMFQADFAVSTASSTIYELLALGTPMISVPVADNQGPIAASLRNRGAGAVLQQGAGEAAFRKAINAYLEDSELRRTRRRRGRELVDGRGVERVVAEVLSLSGK